MRPQVLGFLVVLAAACGGGSSETMANRDASGADAGALAATGKIGPAGGVVSLGAASITIPPGALSKQTLITLSQRSDFPPPQYQTYSPFYEFDPPGLTFAIPAVVVLPRYSGPALEAVYWSKAQGSGYDRLASDLLPHAASASVTHFSTGFVGTPAVGDASVVEGSATRDSGRDGGRDATTGRDGSGSGSSASAGSSAGRDAGSSSGSGSGSSSAAGCTIGGTFYASGSVNPSNACESCQVAVSAAAWSNVSDGAACASGEVCRAGACAAGCFVGGTVYASGAANPNDACQSCQPGTSTSGWTKLSDGTSCGNGQVCSGGACGTQCDIGGTVYASGAANPGNACQGCLPGTSTSSWTALTDGTGCGAGEICSAASCTPGCLVGGAFYASGSPDPANACQSCQPATTTSAWSNVAAGTSCGAGEVCSGGTCGAGCSIGGSVYASGAAEPGNACEVCVPGTSTTSWSAASDGTSCGAGQICVGGACRAYCDIGGSFYASGSLNPSNACQSCQPGTTTIAWTNAASGASCASGSVCSAGSCGAGCFVGGAFYPNGSANPNNACQTCESEVSTSGWGTLSDGTSCGNGQVCASGACGTQCDIGGTFYTSGAVNPGNACQSCLPGTSTSSWTTLADGTTCGGGEICSSASCVSGCFIAGMAYASGTSNPANACQTCQPGASTSSWTTGADGTSCGGGEICAGGTCAAECDIGGGLYGSGVANPNNACQSCQPGTSASAWTTLSDGTSCGSGEICAAGTCAAECDIGGTVYASAAVNPNNACQSCEPTGAGGTTGWSTLADGTSCGNGQICGSGTCGTQCDIGGTIYASAAVNPNNECQSCQPGTTTSAWATLADGTSCGDADICVAGACGAQCDIGGTVYASGATNPSNMCESCIPATSTSAWSSVSGETSLCGSTCVNEQTDSNNCGACGNACTVTGQTCQAGACTCPTAAALCGAACVNEQSDSNNCGACGTVCGPNEACQNSACVVVDPTSSLTCTYSSQNDPGPVHGDCTFCIFPPEVSVTQTNVPMYFTDTCSIISSVQSGENLGLVLDAPLIWQAWEGLGGPLCLGVSSAYPGDLVAEPVDAFNQWTGLITIDGTIANVSVTSSFSSTLCQPNCVVHTFTCSGGGTVSTTDTCLTSNGGCDPNATCTWTGPTSNTCACNTPYTGNGTTCTPPPDQCLTNNGGCDPNATCTFGAPDWTVVCTCNAGYTGNGTTCVANP